MKQILILMAMVLVCTKIIAQIIPLPPIIPMGNTKRATTYTLDQKEIELGNTCLLYIPKYENQLIRAVLSFKPSKKTFEMLEQVKFQNLTIDYIIHPMASDERRKIYYGRLEIDREDIVSKKKLFSSRELFSFSDYDWEWEDVPLGTKSKEIRIVVFKLLINGKETQKLPDFFEDLSLEFKFEKSKSRFEDLSMELLNRGIYPNKEAFDILFNSNPKVFYENKKRLSSNDLSSLVFPKVEEVEQPSKTYQDYNYKKDELQTLKRDLELIIKSVKLKKIFSKDAKRIKKQLEEILGFINQALKSKISISTDTGNLVFTEIQYIIKSINESRKSKNKIVGEQLNDFDSLIDDVTFIISLLNNSSNSTGSLNDVKRIDNFARLVSHTTTKSGFIGDDVSVYVVANIFNNIPAAKHPANGYYVKCVPWGLRKEDLSKLEDDDVLWTFPFHSTPTSYPDLLPVANYCFWVEDDEGNKIALDQEGNWEEMVKIRPQHNKMETWLRRLLDSDTPIQVWLGIL